MTDKLKGKINPLGPFVIRERHRIKSSPKPGMRQAWTEYQVVQGRTIVSRHDLRKHAEAHKRELEQP